MSKTWFKTPAPLPNNAQIAVIGGGIAGVTAYLHLRDKGFKTTLLERSERVFSNASGNPAAILEPFIGITETNRKIFYSKAFEYALSFYKTLHDNIFHPSELIKIPKDVNEKERFEKFVKNCDPAAALLKDNQLHFPQSGYVYPKNIEAQIEDYENCIVNKEITRLEFNEQWTLYDQDGDEVLNADAVILCNANDIKKIDQTKHIEMDEVQGRITYLKPQYKDNKILSGKKYLTPEVKTDHGNANICGATFEREYSLMTDLEADLDNIEQAPYPFEEKHIIGGRKSTRAMPRDHMPICGPVPDYAAYLEEYDGLHHGPRHKKFADAPYHENLYVCAGLGARGFLSAPLLARYLTAMIAGEKAPITETICHAIHPGRFIIRKLSKK